jgi:hypothetical protein
MEIVRSNFKMVQCEVAELMIADSATEIGTAIPPGKTIQIGRCA